MTHPRDHWRLASGGRGWRLLALLASAGAAIAAAGSAAQQATFRSGVEVVQVDVSVTSRNRPVIDLAVGDFALSDNGVAQTILDVTREAVPIDLTLILDASPTGGALVRGSIVARSLRDAISRIRERLKPDDRVSLITFGSRVEQRLPLGPISAIDRIDPVQSGPMVLAPGETALYDALALSLPTSPVSGRRQLAIVFSAGRDTASFIDEGTALEIARRSSAVVFVVGSTVDPNPLLTAEAAGTRPFTRDYITGSRRLPTAFLTRIAEDTGGRVDILEPAVYTANSPQRVAISMSASRNKLEDGFVRALDNFRASYVLRYTPRDVTRGGWHDIAVRVTGRGSYDVVARRGYDGG